MSDPTKVIITAIVDKFKKHPSYLKKGNAYLSELWDVSVEEVQRARIEMNPSSEEVEMLPLPEVLSKLKTGLVDPKTIHVKSLWEDAKGEIKCSYEVSKSSSPVIEEDLTDLFRSIEKTSKIKKYPLLKRTKEQSEEVILTIELGDLHIGKIGNNLILEELEQRIFDIVQKTQSNYIINKVVLVNLGDIFNSDGASSATTKGTKQTDHQHFTESFKQGTTFVVSIIESLLKNNFTVDFINQTGNHCVASEYYLGEFISAYFRNYPEVYVYKEPKRYAANYGVVSVMYDHGEVKPKDYPYIFATEFAEIWSKGKQRFIVCGHRHSQHTYEFPGCILRYLPSAATHNDHWHYTNGYVGAQVGITGSVYSLTKGLVSTFFR